MYVGVPAGELPLASELFARRIFAAPLVLGWHVLMFVVVSSAVWLLSAD